MMGGTSWTMVLGLARRLALLGLAVCLTVEPVQAGAPGSEGRAVGLQTACQGGSDAGSTCEADSDCAFGRCRPVFVQGSGRPIPLRVTLIIDEDVSMFDGTETVPNVVAATAMIEAQKGNERILLSEIYQNLAGGTADAVIDAIPPARF